MKIKKYNRENAVEYAKLWAYKRNPKYYNFDSVGGDCTSFVSQCLYAGGAIMNYSENGWYYKNGYNKSPSWSGVEFLYQFLINNKNIGPFGSKSTYYEVEKGDLIQLSFNGEIFSHSLIIVDVELKYNNRYIYVATHTDDSYYRELSTYHFKDIRFIKIDGIKTL